ncbi:MAG TPA: protein kinase [Bryobacteraceae bacterium]|nr:protein kinase [Bryobacteraceae bacterium]
MNLEIGTQLGDYRLLSRIGKGSYGVVFEAEHAITRRIDALKLMLYAGPAAADDEQRFLREIQVQASLQHPNIAAVYTAFRTEWGPALVMELVRGESLRAVMDRRQLTVREGVGYMQEALRGLNAAERHHVVHRDIKPENILITQDGLVKLTDFGLAHVVNGARLTGSGENIGTPCYMSPEQVIGTEPVDGRSDIYSAGIVLYEVVTGRPPFLGTNGFAVMLAQRQTPPVPPIELNPAVGARLNRIILTALEKDPDRRFPTAAEFNRALGEVVAQLDAHPVPVPLPVPKRNRWKWIGFTAAASTLSCAAILVAGHIARRPSEKPQAVVSPAPATVQMPAPVPAPTPAVAPEVQPPAITPAPPEPQPTVVAAEPATPVHAEHRRTTARTRTPAPVPPVPVIAADESDRSPAAAPMTVAEKPEGSAPAIPQPQQPNAAPQSAASFESTVAPPAPNPPADADKAADTSAKRRNPMVRAFGKLFHKKGSTAPSPAKDQ